MKGRWRLALLATLLLPSTLSAQAPPTLRIERASGEIAPAPVAQERGYAAVELSVFDDLGWSVTSSAGEVEISVPGQIRIALRLGSPFFRWDGIVLQLADPPYSDSERTLVPLQLLSDFFPRRLPDLYEFDGPTSTLRAGDPGLIATRTARDGLGDPAPSPGSEPEAGSAAASPGQQGPSGMPTSPTLAPSAYEGTRVVIVDAGHGGEDPGAIGPDGTREKDVALGIATRVAEVLREVPGIEVHMTRNGDTFVDVWERGPKATDSKGERPGVFVSIHANSFPTRRTTRGFETYFLSEARTEHERRVAAIENAPLRVQGQDIDPEQQPDLGFILRELRNLDHQHWSALLAELVQDELDGFHPGPNRGVKQGILAVLTNALMPSVLVETGYLSNQDEARLLGADEFQAAAGEAVARAVLRFFERYPPGSGTGGAEGGS